MKKILPLVLMTAALAGCGGTSNVKPNSAVYVTAPDKVAIQSPIPFSEGNTIKRNIKDECTINTQLAQFISMYGNQNGIDVELRNSVKPNDKGYVLVVEIADAISQGNAFIGHNKYTQIKGTLYDNGVKLASFRGARHSSGGFFAGYKGSCSVLGRTVRALGSDVALWLKKPWNNATLGDI